MEQARPNEAGGASKKDVGKPPVTQGFLWKFRNAIRAVAEVSQFGANKYDVPVKSRDVMKLEDGADRMADAMTRHLDADYQGPSYDDDSGLLHAAHAAWSAMCRLEMLLARVPVKTVMPRAVKWPEGMIWKADVGSRDTKPEPAIPYDIEAARARGEALDYQRQRMEAKSYDTPKDQLKGSSANRGDYVPRRNTDANNPDAVTCFTDPDKVSQARAAANKAFVHTKPVKPPFRSPFI